MTDYPWGPHGPQVPPNAVTPNPTAPSSPQQFGGSDNATAPFSGGGGSGLGGVLAQIIFGLVLVALLWLPMACIYPLTALAGLVAGFGTTWLLAHMVSADMRDVAVVLGFGVGVAVVLMVYRLEYRLAQDPAFRRTRHVVRMALLAVWAIPIIQLSMGATAPTTTTRYVFAMVTNPRELLSFLIRPLNLVIWAAVLVGLHFLLWSGEPVRRWWHRRLTFVGLK